MSAIAAKRHLDIVARASKTPGLQYVVVNAADIVFEYASGMADLRRQTATDTGTTMMAYSMSKTITAIAVLQLVDAGAVGLDDPVDRYVEAQPYGSRVTVRQLLSHTAGIPNPIPLRWVHPSTQHETFDEGAALSAILRKYPRLSFEPGTKYRYSNIGYWLLGKVAERASGQAFTKYVEDHIIGPLGISSRELAFTVADRSRHATGYLEKYSPINLIRGFLIDRDLIGDYTGRWLEIRSHYLNGPAFGGLVGTSTAFGRLLQDQLRKRSVLVGDKTRPLLYMAQRTVRGDPVAMTLGWHIDDRGGTGCFFKEGGGGGFRCMMRLYLDRGIGTVVMANATGFPVRQLLNTTDGFFLSA